MKLLPDPIIARLRDVRAALENRLAGKLARSPTFDAVPLTKTTSLPIRLLMGTSSGLVYYDRGRLRRLIDGYIYGVTRYADRWYAFRQCQNRYPGHIISFGFDVGGVADPRHEVGELGPWVHQLQAWNGHLYVTDTKNNRLIRFHIGRHGLKRERHFYANGWLQRNEVHLNSVYCHQDEIYVMYHNRTHYTGRTSQIAVLTDGMQLNRIIETRAGSAHNIAIWQGTPIYCDSEAGSLVWNGPVIRTDCFTRGLAVASQFVLVGGSEFAKREDRSRAKAYIFAVDLKERRLIAKLTLPSSGSLLELRLIEPNDYGMGES